ncbi:MAG: nitroreductase family deazaflavin-dependent oxidoreductase [Acidimicrobiales bacterium]|nr:nitroreductase family deazaflavin-dependent oxidoreductase [Acidimicrobiales bacterium]
MAEDGYTAPDIMLLGEEHVQRYRETDGEEGYLWNGATALLLTTTGRKSGLGRTSPLIFAAHEGNYLVVASMGGAPMHPQWYLNLEANAAARVQIKGDVIDVEAHTATAEEKPALWAAVNEQWPNYEVYQSRTEREIPVVVLTPLAAS